MTLHPTFAHETSINETLDSFFGHSAPFVEPILVKGVITNSWLWLLVHFGMLRAECGKFVNLMVGGRLQMHAVAPKCRSQARAHTG